MRTSLKDESGSEIVSHVLVQVLVLILVSATLQLAFALHIRNSAVDAASEAARYLSLRNASEAQARLRAQALLESSFAGTQATVSFRLETVGELDKVTASVATTLPIIGPWGLPESLQVEASAWRRHE
ncbi:hypothetical protein HMPREF0044_0778 [Gleimia coleocanis DSM 15436]|uniref:TadE-like protein n=1 Tax=Gleimia coleocanis DSM 15436 TaxID=525245 RepID=C0VZQ0_9ACTO|nr:hypothetical protein [Gleimia coleocanis]EEH63759.1 hypothetical protein HMPREF0044_0778 [Gleimia coleocanis DSM 15436]